jgi:carbon monoxide dehydrogenase subunit G
MQLNHQFTVPAPIDAVWPVLLDLERIAPCMPGAALTSFDGDHFTGIVKVKLGPIGLTFNGKGSITAKDEQARRFGIMAGGQDVRGAGAAEARISVVLSEPSPGSTQADVVTDLSISGKAASMGRGMISDVSGKLLNQFVSCLSTQFAEIPAAVPVPVAKAPEAEPVPSAAAPEAVPVPAAKAPEAEPQPAMAVAAEPAAPEPIPVAEAIPAGTPEAVVTGAALSTESTAATAVGAPAVAPAPEMQAAAASTTAPKAAAAPVVRAEPEPVDLLAVTGAGRWLGRLGFLVLGAIIGGLVVWLLMR